MDRQILIKNVAASFAGKIEIRVGSSYMATVVWSQIPS